MDKNGINIISVANETGSIQIIGLENIEKIRNFLNELKEMNYNMRDPFIPRILIQRI
ncbi:hypothetical protein [Paenibacillus macquariensis]|uniref:hypothetical protein n=1 Tax=Paenibacillus macquariensis TaxID=948756 RepID=UPI0014721BCC|nr:hypothetical protein [Paenibacillus macquariensis]